MRRGTNEKSIICNYRNDLCKLCKYSIKNFEQSDKIVEATVNLATEKAKIVADDSLTDQEIINLVEKAGYGAIVNDKAHKRKSQDRRQEKRETCLYLFGFL